MTKGQMFIIAGVLLIISFISMKAVLEIYPLSNQLKHLETKTTQDIQLIEHEYAHIIAIKKASSPPYLKNFTIYLQNNVRNLKVLYVFTYINNTQYSVNTGNFMGDKVNITLQSTNSNDSYVNFILNHTHTITKKFSATGNVNLSIIYQYQGKEYMDNTTFDIPANKTIYYSDIRINDYLSLRRKNIYEAPVWE